jgi:hypothetical protein
MLFGISIQNPDKKDLNPIPLFGISIPNPDNKELNPIYIKKQPLTPIPNL